MRNKIAFKLMLYFSAALIFFSIVIGGIFLSLFRGQMTQAKKEQMLRQGQAVTAALGESLLGQRTGAQQRGQPNIKRRDSLTAYLRLLDGLGPEQAWIVDENLELLTGPRTQRQYLYADLPRGAERIVKEVFEGQTGFSQSFDPLLDTPSLTLGLPIRLDTRVVGALLLHAPIQGIRETTAQGIRVFLISILLALLLSGLLTIPLALSLAKPLKKMKDTALALAGGDYAAQTEVKREDEIGALAAAIDTLAGRLKAARQESDKLDQLRRDFVANISHELKTPITVIRGSLEALADGVISKPQQVADYHRQMLVESKYLQGMVNDLLELSKLQNPDFHIEFDRVNLCDVLRDAVRSARQMAREKDITLSLDMEKSVHPLQGDYARLRQMLLIVLGNAIKFSPEGGRVEVKLEDHLLCVTDEGPGIAPELLPHIFDRFYKAHSDDNKEGSGLGLAIAKEIAQRHGISLSVCNRAERGAEVRFALQS